MIRFEGGRTYSVRAASELQAQVEEQLRALTPEERELLELLIAEQQLEVEGKLAPEVPRLLPTVERVEWREQPVDIRTFVYDDYYLGKTCSDLYEPHLRSLQELFDNGGYHEAIWTGSIGTGKSFCAAVGMCRVLYEISCMADPHAAYHIAAHTPIHLVCLSVTEDLAIKVAFDYIIEKLQQSAYFQEKFPFKPGKKEFRFPNKISLAARATTDTSALGLNVISLFLDESDFIKKPGKARQAAGEKDMAEKLYNKLKRRIKSRFQRAGRLPGMLFVVSSKGRTDDFTSRHILAARNDPNLFVWDGALWDVKRDSYSAETFKVFVGNDTLPSRILKPEEAPEYETVAATNDNCVVIDVPVDFRDDFERELEDAIRDLAGIATVTVAPFIQRRDRIKAAAAYGEANGLFHPFVRHGEPLHDYVPGLGGEFQWDRLVEQVRQPLAEGGHELALRPRLNPFAARHVHIDPSKNGDSTGLCIAHVAGFKEVVRRDSNRREYAERAPVIVVDLLLRIVPPLGDELILGDVRALAYQWQDHGYRIGFASMDSWQSFDGIQQMNLKGIPAEVVSIDRTTEPYDMLKTALYEGRLIFYGHPKLMEELRKLEKNHQTGKVDHPPLGSKDVADALAGVVHSLTARRTQSSDPLPLLRGVSYAPGSEAPLVVPPSHTPSPGQIEPARPTVSRAPLLILRGEDETTFNPDAYEP